jgi:hypothetical protein
MRFMRPFDEKQKCLPHTLEACPIGTAPNGGGTGNNGDYNYFASNGYTDYAQYYSNCSTTGSIQFVSNTFVNALSGDKFIKLDDNLINKLHEVSYGWTSRNVGKILQYIINEEHFYKLRSKRDSGTNPESDI